MRIPIIDTDTVGIISDTSPHELPLQAWSAGQNVRVQDGAIERILGHQSLSAALTIDPLFMLPVGTDAKYFWLVAGSAKVRAVYDNTSADITRLSGDYAAVDALPWTGGNFNGVTILNNGADMPQYWNPQTAATRLADLPNWNAAWRAKAIRPFKNFLVALDVTKSGVRYPQMVKWSHAADPLTVPTSWNEADPTKDAGEWSLLETDAPVVDCLPLGNMNILYKEDSAHAMQYVGGEYIFAFRRLFKEVGLLNRNAVKGFTHKGDQHIVLGPDDVFVHDGQGATPILAERMRKWLYANLDETNYKSAFIALNPWKTEAWICFPSVGATEVNTALVWNWRANTFTVRELPEISYAEAGMKLPVSGGIASDTWATDNTSWSADTTIWGYQYNSRHGRLIMAKGGAEKALYLTDTTNQFQEENFLAYVERTGLTVVGRSPEGKPIQDSETVKLLREVWPRVEAEAGTVIDVYVGVQDTRDKPVQWSGPYPFTVGQDKKVNPLVSGKILSVRFSCSENRFWKLFGYDLEVVPIGKY